MTAPQTPHEVPGDARPVVKIDSRRRVSLARVTRVRPGDQFFITVQADGAIHLTPTDWLGNPAGTTTTG